MKKTLTCTCGGNLSYSVTRESEADFADKYFYSKHTGKGHEVTEQPGVDVCDEGN